MVRPTEIQRATVSQEMRCILTASPVDVVRTVQVLTPDGPSIALSTVPAQAYGANKFHAYPRMPVGQSIEIKLLPTQQLFAMAEDGIAEISLIIEYGDE